MSAKIALPVQVVLSMDETFLELRSADRVHTFGGVVSDGSIPDAVALAAADAAAVVINKSMTPAWTWAACDGSPRFRVLVFRGSEHDRIRATDGMAQAVVDGLNAAAVEP